MCGKSSEERGARENVMMRSGVCVFRGREVHQNYFNLFKVSNFLTPRAKIIKAILFGMEYVHARANQKIGLGSLSRAARVRWGREKIIKKSPNRQHHQHNQRQTTKYL